MSVWGRTQLTLLVSVGSSHSSFRTSSGPLGCLPEMISTPPSEHRVGLLVACQRWFQLLLQNIEWASWLPPEMISTPPSEHRVALLVACQRWFQLLLQNIEWASWLPARDDFNSSFRTSSGPLGCLPEMISTPPSEHRVGLLVASRDDFNSSFRTSSGPLGCLPEMISTPPSEHRVGLLVACQRWFQLLLQNIEWASWLPARDDFNSSFRTSSGPLGCLPEMISTPPSEHRVGLLVICQRWFQLLLQNIEWASWLPARDDFNSSFRTSSGPLGCLPEMISTPPSEHRVGLLVACQRWFQLLLQNIEWASWLPARDDFNSSFRTSSGPLGCLPEMISTPPSEHRVSLLVACQRWF